MDESRKAFEQYAADRLGLPLEMISDARNGDRYMHAFDSMSVMQPINGWWTLWQESRSAIEIDVEKLKIELENLECAQICLDELGVPRREGSEELSMWGRIVRYAAGIKVKE